MYSKLRTKTVALMFFVPKESTTNRLCIFNGIIKCLVCFTRSVVQILVVACQAMPVLINCCILLYHAEFAGIVLYCQVISYAIYKNSHSMVSFTLCKCSYCNVVKIVYH